MPPEKQSTRANKKNNQLSIKSGKWAAAPIADLRSSRLAKNTTKHHPSPLESKLKLQSFMTQTHGGGRIEDVVGLNRRRAMTSGLPGGMPLIDKQCREHSATPESVRGEDDRVKISDTSSVPWRSICHLLIERQDGRNAFGTAWFAGPRVLVTAGHCILDHRHGGWANRITAVPGSNGLYPPPFGTFKVTNAEVSPRWEKEADPNFDVGILVVDDDVIGHTLGWFGLSVIDDRQAEQLMVNIGGFPDKKGRGTLWCNAGRIISVDEYFLSYMIDTEIGQSGSPVFWCGPQGERLVVAIHVYSEFMHNKGRRILEDVFYRVQELQKSS